MADKMVIDARSVNNPLTALNVDYYGPEAFANFRNLEALGVSVVGVRNVVQALYFLNSHSFNIIAINMELPGALQMIVHLRQNGVGSKLIGFTNQKEEKIVEFLHEGLDYCLEKPVSFHGLAAILERIHDDD